MGKIFNRICLALVLFLLTGHLAWSQNLENWTRQRKALEQYWITELGTPEYAAFRPEVVSLGKFRTPEFEGELLLQQNSPVTQQRLLLMKPLNLVGRAPGALVPYYDPDTMCGYDLKTKEPLPKMRLQARFASHLVKLGFVVLCTEAYPYNDKTGTPEEKRGLVAEKKKRPKLWLNAANELKAAHPNWSGMGKLVADLRLATDYLVSLDCVDSSRLAIAGHSLGGKMSFYAGCLDKRISAIWASDFGIRWDDTNWHDPWYWGPEKIEKFKKEGVDQSSLLMLHAPNLFILIAGQADNEKSVELLKKAEAVYRLYGKEKNICFYNHASGHQPIWPTVIASLKRLAEEFNMPITGQSLPQPEEEPKTAN